MVRKMIGKSLVMVPVLVVLTSCIHQTVALRETNVPTPSIPEPTAPGPEEKPVKPPLATCQSAQRDLGRVWEDRRYYCVPEGVSLKTESTWRRLNRSAARAVRVTQDVVTESWQVAAESVMSHLVGRSERPSEVPALADPKSPASKVVRDPARLASASSAEETVATAVWFAPDVEVLGLQGSQRALSVLEEAKRASRVYLRGHASPLDVTRADHDQLAIGRAYSLRKFFESHGIAPERITILHRNPEVQSRHVEVMLRG